MAFARAFISFMSFITTCHPSILRARAPEPLAAQVESLRAETELPRIKIGPGTDEIFREKKAEKQGRRKSWPLFAPIF
jgi:hypothetical protein